MKTIVISDLHGTLIPIEEEFDLLIMCGDGEPVWNHKRQFHFEWLKTTFSEWVNNLPYRNEESKVIMIAGNHSFCLEGITKTKKEEWLSNIKDNRLVYLDNEAYSFKNGGKTYKIFGCPYCEPLYGWPFTRTNLKKYYDFIPYNLDILITHDAPDLIDAGVATEGRVAGRNFGNKVLAEYVLERKPKYLFFGHIHSSGIKEITEYKGIKMANASILNEEYDVAYSPIIIEI